MEALTSCYEAYMTNQHNVSLQVDWLKQFKCFIQWFKHFLIVVQSDVVASFDKRKLFLLLHIP